MSEENETAAPPEQIAAKKARKPRSPNQARWQMAHVNADGTIVVLDDKYINPEQALAAIEKNSIEGIGYLVRAIETKLEVKARLV